MRLGDGLRHGAFGGAALGGVVGLADCLRAAVEGGTVLTPAHWPKVVLLYAALWVPLGVLAGLVGGRFRRPARASVLLTVLGTGAFAVGAWVNVVHLPSFTAPASLTFDALLLAGAAVLFLGLYLLPVPVPAPRVRTWLVLLALPVVAAAGAAALSGGVVHDDVEVAAPARDRPNLLVFLVDSLRADHLGAYGYVRETSPHFDAFAREAVVFEDFRTASTWTKPSTASLLTGLLPTAHGAVEHRQVLPDAAVTLAEVLRSAGYRTAAFSDNPFVSPEFGFGQGFDRFDHMAPSPFVNGTLLGKTLWTLQILSIDGHLGAERLPEDRGSAELSARLLGFAADGPPDRPWFAYVHAMEPHVPYDPPEPFRGEFADPGYAGPERRYPPRFQGFLPFEQAPALDAAGRQHLVDRYDEEVLCWDAAFGAMIEALRERGLLERTVVVVLSDHGEEFYEHGGVKHGHSLFEELVHVPLAIRVPDLKPARLPFAARGTDLVPTLTGLLRIGWDAPLFGVDLSPAIEEGDFPPAAPVVSEVRFGGAGATSIVVDGKKLILAHRGSERVELAFDLRADPGELRSLPDPGWAPAHRARLEQVLRAARAAALRSDERSLSDAEEEALRGLGYTR